MNEYNHTNNIVSLAYLESGLLTSASFNQIIDWDISNEKQVFEHYFSNKNSFILLTPLHNNMMASASENEIKIYNTSNRTYEKFTLKIKQLEIKSMLSIDENRLAIGTGDGKVIIWRIKENAKKELKGHSKSIRHLVKSKFWLQ